MVDNKAYFEPSTELLSNEYEISEEREGTVHIFCLHDLVVQENLPKTIKNIFEFCNYIVPKKNIHIIKDKEEVNDVVADIQNEDSSKTINYLILFFIGYINDRDSEFTLDNEDKLSPQYISYCFYANQASMFRNTPKAFIFLGFTANRTNSVVFDSRCAPPPVIVYNKPPEADIVIAFKKYTTVQSIKDYLEMVKLNVKYNFKRKDFISLLTHATYVSSAPLIISTLTKRLYLVPCEYRGVEFDIDSNLEELSNAIDNNINKNTVTRTSTRRASADTRTRLPSFSGTGKKIPWKP